ncbi:M23 family metallopeptidase [Sphingomonas sp. AOB5]|uniref:M23 family metallopeptidase n=1 Tax=Sphingomonas sp. AOB5 TaxID=3034017 RepID=UPI0023F9805E|nr:M23 family metallopeptidase [Sphingomonas sp. AOB5]MDF7777789.1 M23 family metallopeptidase [Sphingomonas sp. AOB5]
MFLRNDHGLDTGGGSVAIPYAANPAPAAKSRFADFDFTPDLGSRIGSATWFRGAATCVALCGLTFLISPGFENPIYGSVPAALHGADREAAKAQAIAPLSQGAKSGRHMAATALVAPLSDTPERPEINTTAKLASGGTLMGALQRAGVGGGDADRVVDLLGGAITLADIPAGTPLDITLGRRENKSQPRPLKEVEFRARFDLSVKVVRNNGELALIQTPIAIDNTPLRIQGAFGPSLYRSARAAGAPAKAVEAYIRSVNTRMPVGRIGSGCKFDIIVEQARAETGEVRMGNLLYAGVAGCSNQMQLVRMEVDGRDSWFDGAGRGARTGMMAMPAAGRISSGFGMRRHPILGYARMHKGLDVAAPWGAPVYAATDGVVVIAGRSSGYGNFIKLNHAGGYGTGYGHLSRIFVRPGQRVRKGQQIGAVGSTGMSTGPHLHYELYRNGVAVNPRSVSFSVVQQLGGNDLAVLRSRLGRLMAVPVGGSRNDDEE